MSISESNRFSDIFKWESEGSNRYSRQAVSVATTQSLSVGEVIGRNDRYADTVTYAAGNTGDNAAAFTLGTGAKIGTYQAVCATNKTAGSETWNVYDPNGAWLGTATTGVTFTNTAVQVVISTGTTTAATTNDTIYMPVSRTEGSVGELSFSATDGKQYAYGVMAETKTTGKTSLTSVAVVRDATVSRTNLVWPSGATDAQKLKALEELRERGIVYDRVQV